MALPTPPVPGLPTPPIPTDGPLPTPPDPTGGLGEGLITLVKTTVEEVQQLADQVVGLTHLVTLLVGLVAISTVCQLVATMALIKGARSSSD